MQTKKRGTPADAGVHSRSVCRAIWEFATAMLTKSAIRHRHPSVPGPRLQKLLGQTGNRVIRSEVGLEVRVQRFELLVAQRRDPLAVIEAVAVPCVLVHLEHDDRYERVAVLAVLEHEIAPGSRGKYAR